MSKYQIVASGVGGQGLLSFANILGEAATNIGKNVVVTTAYGAESRGTFTKADLIISDEGISYPECTDPDIVLCFAQVAYQRYYDKMKPGSLLIYDSDMVTPDDNCAAAQFGHPFTAIARELGREGSANLVAAGYMLKKAPVLDIAAVEEALRQRFGKSQKAVDQNNLMIHTGMELE
ncbi:MAG: 2-oxoacid:acceptor oxidoreductase family protein [Oscillospiraceae bacterium]|nr:2-oxoacid:acceptor oxidoreductase family protein [Oscillospiraceae bacterium]